MDIKGEALGSQATIRKRLTLSDSRENSAISCQDEAAAAVSGADSVNKEVQTVLQRGTLQIAQRSPNPE